MADNQEQAAPYQPSFGDKAAGRSFNPSNNPKVETLKKMAAMFIDECNNARMDAEDPEVKRMYSVAITEMLAAQMWSVKAATWQS